MDRAVWESAAGRARPAILVAIYLPNPKKWESGFKLRRKKADASRFEPLKEANSMDYVLSMFAFVIVIVGVLGKTRSDAVSGLRGIRPIGWITVIFAFFTLLVSLYTTSQKNTELEKARDERAVRERVASEQILSSLNRTFEGVDVAYREFIGGASFREFENLKEETFVAFLNSFNTLDPMNDPKYIGYDGTMIRMMEDLTNKRLDEFEVRLHAFGDLLPPDALKLAHEFRGHAGFKLFTTNANMAEWADQAQRETRGKPLPYPVIRCNEQESDCWGRSQYIRLLNEAIKLRGMLENWRSKSTSD